LISERTRVLIWCSALPAVVVTAAAAILMLIPYYDRLTGDGSHFVFLHFHLARLVPILFLWAVVLICAVISLFYDKKRRMGK
jgi:hypothetical protein